MIYLDNAATSFPKPASVPKAVADFLTNVGGSAGRSGHRLAAEAARIVFDTRESLAELMGVSDSRRILYTANATESLNLALTGYLKSGDHVITTSIEHNSVLRPLYHLQEAMNVHVSIIQSDKNGWLDPEAIGAAIKSNTKLVVINHASNVTGAISPIADIRRAIGGVPFLVDGAQTAGAIPIHLEEMGIDIFAFPGHKSLLGPQGVGGLYIRKGLSITPLVHGGTGSGSEGVEQPEVLPDYYESGTLNGPGIAGLGAGVHFLLETGIDEVRRQEMVLYQRLYDGLCNIEGLTLYGLQDVSQQMPTISCNLSGHSSSDLAHKLDRQFAIMTRPALHCSPMTHKSIGTFPDGTLRFSMSFLNTISQMDRVVEAMNEFSRMSLT